ncbi:hypothetical protein DFH07DRAFT_971548 [Mycena maculata]|uniref:Protein kinase domain-containing protein n=1 Tax=Mycena maculata TaxID=230809 RepID=A0AAD7HLU8_9AGAR|nr:hypothetical protein DFH07DRAFT_971548 [Mycena maculata]
MDNGQRVFSPYDTGNDSSRLTEPLDAHAAQEPGADSLLDAVEDIFGDKVGGEDFMKQHWPHGGDTTLPNIEFDLLIVPEEVVNALTAIASLPSDLKPRYLGATGAILSYGLTISSTLPTPSTCASDPRQLFEFTATLAGRPFRCGPPTSIFDTHLAGLADALRNLEHCVAHPSTSMIQWACKFFRAAINFYQDDNLMETEIRPLLDEILKDGKWQKLFTGGKPEAHGPGWLYESKKQKGIGGDPEVQSIANFQKLLASDGSTMYGELRDQSRLPTILISQAGSQLDIAVGVFAQVLLVDHLFSINLRDGHDLEAQILTLARLATCLSLTGQDLHHYYQQEIALRAVAPVSSTFTSSLHLPAPASAHSLHTAPLGLNFLYKLSRVTGLPVDLHDETDRVANTRHAIFVALGTGENDIPTEGLAPNLYYHTAVRGGLTMLVMEKIDGSTAFRWLSNKQADTRLPLSVYTDVKRAIDRLHSLGFVFGDLRLPNIMIRNGGGEAHALLIDFDWTAPEGVGRYPATISTSREWAPGVEPNGLMDKGHDLFPLDLLHKNCTK